MSVLIKCIRRNSSDYQNEQRTWQRARARIVATFLDQNQGQIASIQSLNFLTDFYYRDSSDQINPDDFWGRFGTEDTQGVSRVDADIPVDFVIMDDHGNFQALNLSVGEEILDGAIPIPKGYDLVYSTDAWRAQDPEANGGYLANGYDAYIVKNKITNEIIVINVGSEGNKFLSSDWLYNYSTAVTAGGGQLESAAKFIDYFFEQKFSSIGDGQSEVIFVGNSLGGGACGGRAYLCDCLGRGWLV